MPLRGRAGPGPRHRRADVRRDPAQPRLDRRRPAAVRAAPAGRRGLHRLVGLAPPARRGRGRGPLRWCCRASATGSTRSRPSCCAAGLARRHAGRGHRGRLAHLAAHRTARPWAGSPPLKAERAPAAVPDTVVVGRARSWSASALSWYESKPLFGWRVLVPRTKEQAGAPVRAAARATARCPPRCRPSRSSRRVPRSRWSARSRAWSPAATSGSRSPRPTRSRRCARSSRTTAWTPARSPGSRSRRSASRPRRRWAPSAWCPTWCPAASSPRPACWRSSRPSTRPSTRSSGSSCRAPTSPPRRCSPAWSSSAGRWTT